MRGSNRKSELAEVTSVDVVDAHTIRIQLPAPFSPMLGAFAYSYVMSASPRQAANMNE